jgi:hypothetical protein
MRRIDIDWTSLESRRAWEQRPVSLAGQHVRQRRLDVYLGILGFVFMLGWVAFVSWAVLVGLR